MYICERGQTAVDLSYCIISTHSAFLRRIANSVDTFEVNFVCVDTNSQRRESTSTSTTQESRGGIEVTIGAAKSPTA